MLTLKWLSLIKCDSFQWFWEAVQEFTKEEQVQLLQFATGTYVSWVLLIHLLLLIIILLSYYYCL